MYTPEIKDDVRAKPKNISLEPEILHDFWHLEVIYMLISGVYHGVPVYLIFFWYHFQHLSTMSCCIVSLGTSWCWSEFVVCLSAVESTGKSNGTCLSSKMRRRCGQWPAAQSRSKWQSPCFLEPHDLQGLGLRKVKKRNGARVWRKTNKGQGPESPSRTFPPFPILHITATVHVGGFMDIPTGTSDMLLSTCQPLERLWAVHAAYGSAGQINAAAIVSHLNFSDGTGVVESGASLRSQH